MTWTHEISNTHNGRGRLEWGLRDEACAAGTGARPYLASVRSPFDLQSGSYHKLLLLRMRRRGGKLLVELVEYECKEEKK